MAADMANNTTFDPIASYARLSERVEGQGRDIVDLRSNMNTGFQNLQGSIRAVSDQIAGSSKTQWPVIWSAIGVSFAVLAAVGALAYRPVLATQDRQELALVRIVDGMVTRQEMNWRAERAAEDRERANTAAIEFRAADDRTAERLARLEAQVEMFQKLIRAP